MMMGIGGQRILLLQANSPDIIHLNLEDKQSWDLESPSSKSFALTAQTEQVLGDNIYDRSSNSCCHSASSLSFCSKS